MHHSNPRKACLHKSRNSHPIAIPKPSLLAPALALRWLVGSALDRLAILSMTSSAFASDVGATFVRYSVLDAPI